MKKLQIFVYTHDQSHVEKLNNKFGKYCKFVSFPWIDYKDVRFKDYNGFRIPAGIDTYTKLVWDKYSTKIDGVMFIPNNWENGEKEIKGLQPAFMSNDYQVMFVKDRDDFWETAGHEIKHIVDNLIRLYLDTTAEEIVGVEDWDNQIVHNENFWYDFDYKMNKLEPYIQKVITNRRTYRQLNVIERLIKDIQMILNRRRVSDNVVEESPVYIASKDAIGTDASPRDLVQDGLGCAESLTTLLQPVVKDFPVVTGTWSLWDNLRAHSAFKRVDRPEKGDIVLSVTGRGNGNLSNGHVGIVMENDMIASNDSRNGLWNKNYTVQSWKDYYVKKGGYDMMIYRFTG